MFGNLLNSVSSGLSSVANSAIGLFYAKPKKTEESKLAETQTVTTIESAKAKEPSPTKRRDREYEKRFIDRIEKGLNVDHVDHEIPMNLKPVIPTPEAHDREFNEGTPPSVIIAEMMGRAQIAVYETEEPAKLKFSAIERKLEKKQEALKKEQKEVFDKKKTASQWESRSRIANYLLSGATFIAGVGTLCAGVPAGAIMMTSSAGSIAAQAMSDFGVDSRYVSATSIASGVLGIAGGISSIHHAPQRFAHGAQKALENGAFVLEALAGAFSSYAGIKSRQNLSEAMKVEALHSVTQTEVKLLMNKLPGNATTLQNIAKSSGNIMKALAKADRRNRDALRMALAAFAA